MAINEAALKALVALLAEGDDPNEEKKTPPVAPPAPEDDGTKAALEARLAELEQKVVDNSQVEPPKEESEGESDEVKELRRRIQEQEDIAVTSSIKSGLTEHQIDPEAFDVLSEFIEYGKLKTEDGSADDEKIATIVDTLTSIALRNPPSGSSKKKSYDPLNQGIGHYLDLGK
jgi:hypothetical protein